MKSFQPIYESACNHVGSEKTLNKRLSKPKTSDEILPTPDDRWLSEITKCVFQAGFSWSLIENKWDRFEEVFEGFNISRWLFMSDDDIDDFLKTEGIVKNPAKIRSIGENAKMLCDLRDEHTSVGAYFSGWKAADYTANIQSLQKQGSRLGGKTAQVFLRRMGIDTPVFTKDVLKALARTGMSGKHPTSNKAWQDTQVVFDMWHKETGYSLTELSQILALSVE